MTGKTTNAIALSLLAAAAAGILCACGARGRGEWVCPSVEPASCAADLSGQWTITDTLSTAAAACAAIDGRSYESVATVTQAGCSLTVEVRGETFHGFVDSSRGCWTGSYSEISGTTTITAMELVLDAAGTGFTGTSAWSWSDGTTACTGTAALTGARQ